MNSQEIANIVMAVLFVSTFICIFYFLYAVKIEEEVVNTQVDLIMDELIDELAFAPESLKTELANYSKKINTNKTNMQEADKKVEDANKVTFHNALKTISIGFVIGMALIYLASFYFNISMKEAFYKNLIMIIFIGLTEYVFLTRFGSKYMSADPNFVKYTVISRLQNI